MRSAELNFPASHSVQSSAELSCSVLSDAKSALDFPAGHNEHNEAPLATATFPALQMLHALAPVVAACVPFSHFVHAALPVPPAYRPTRQSSHVPWAVVRLECLPASHARHASWLLS